MSSVESSRNIVLYKSDCYYYNHQSSHNGVVHVPVVSNVSALRIYIQCASVLLLIVMSALEQILFSSRELYLVTHYVANYRLSTYELLLCCNYAFVCCFGFY